MEVFQEWQRYLASKSVGECMRQDAQLTIVSPDITVLQLVQVRVSYLLLRAAACGGDDGPSPCPVFLLCLVSLHVSFSCSLTLEYPPLSGCVLAPLAFSVHVSFGVRCSHIVVCVCVCVCVCIIMTARSSSECVFLENTLACLCSQLQVGAQKWCE
mgnify:CR=1 FL=1